MGKILLNTIDSNIVDDCCKKLDIKDDYVADSNLYDNTLEITDICNYWNNELENVIDDFRYRLLQLSSKYFNDHTIDILQDLIIFSDEFSEDAKRIHDATVDVVARYRSETVPARFTVLCDDEHIKELIDDHCDEQNICLELIYDKGEFLLALSHSTDIDNPFLVEVIAKGDSQAIVDVLCHIRKVSPKAEKLCEEAYYSVYE